MMITSNDNSRIKYLCSLKKKNIREKERKVFLEGERIVCDSEKFGAQIESVYYSEDYSGATVPCDESFELSKRVFGKIAETVSPQGIAAVASMPHFCVQDICESCIILCDNVRDPGNMGTIIRTAHAVGAAVLLTEGCADIYSLKAVRASMGSVFAVRCAACDMGDIEYLKSSGYRLLCSMLHTKSENLFEADICGKRILAVGNEANGMSDAVANEADGFVKIPMPGGAESLNAAVSASVMMYEYFRRNTVID